MVDFLAAEVPNVDAEGVAVGEGEVPADDVDTFGGFFVFGKLVRFVVNCFCEGGFASAAFSDEDKLCFVKRNFLFRVRSRILMFLLQSEDLPILLSALKSRAV